MASEPQAFSPMYLSMMRVAEARGGLPETLRRLAAEPGARQTLIRQARTAMIYPIGSSCRRGHRRPDLGLAAPDFRDLSASSAGRDPPLPSRVLIAFSDFVRYAGWWLMPVVLVGPPFLLFRSTRRPPARR